MAVLGSLALLTPQIRQVHARQRYSACSTKVYEYAFDSLLLDIEGGFTRRQRQFGYPSLVSKIK